MSKTHSSALELADMIFLMLLAFLTGMLVMAVVSKTKVHKATWKLNDCIELGVEEQTCVDAFTEKILVLIKE